MSEVQIRRMTMADIDAVHAIEAATFAIPWSREDFEREVTTNVCARYLVAELDGQVIGYAGAWVIIDEAHVTNIAIEQSFRGQGIGRKLTEGLMQYVANLGVVYVTLEVRRSNLVAQSLYKSLGFLSVGVRKKYYTDNQEDAFLFCCDHMPAPDPDFEEPETVHE